MTLAGGIRARLIYDSIHNMIDAALDDLGWYDAGRKHKPINFIAVPTPLDQEIPMNTLALSDEDQLEFEQELGSNLAEHRWTYYLDFYAEDDVIGKHFAYDLKDILAGRLPDVGREFPQCDVYDYQLATPDVAFVVQFENVFVDKAHDFPKPWQKHWYAVRFTVIDSYG